VLRLWVSMVDYREDIRLGKEILARVVEAYRKFRNVLRVLLANLYDFDPAKDGVPKERMLEVDRWVMARYASVATRMVTAYDDYDYPAIYQAANQFITVDLSAFYVDITKDRMYTFGAASEARRSGQTAMFTVVDGLARLLAPILPFTMDEVWRNLPGERAASVHLEKFPRGLDAWRDDSLSTEWEKLRAIRDAVNIELERARQEKAIGSNLSARVELEVDAEALRFLSRFVDFLPTLFGVSDVGIGASRDAAGDTADGGVLVSAPLRVRVRKADGVKCERCWRYVPTVSPQGICDRCTSALESR
jgi:isoleucyl-tRNA synthetase